MMYDNSYKKEIIPGNQTTPQGQVGSMVTLPYIVANIQNELDDYSPALYKRAMQIVIDGVREMRLYHQSVVQVGYFVIPDSGVLYYPPDYISYIKIGIPICGNLITLSVNPNMLLNRAQVCGEDIRRIHAGAADLPLDGYAYAPHYDNNGNFIGSLYGAGGGFNIAYFREDKTAQRFEFDGIIPRIAEERIVVMEYESTGISANTAIRPECIEPLKNWYFMKANRHRSDVSGAQKAQYKDDYEKSVKKLRAFTQEVNPTKFYDLFYRNFKQSPKPL